MHEPRGQPDALPGAGLLTRGRPARSPPGASSPPQGSRDAPRVVYGAGSPVPGAAPRPRLAGDPTRATNAREVSSQGGRRAIVALLEGDDPEGRAGAGDAFFARELPRDT